MDTPARASRRRHSLERLALTACLAALPLIASASPAAASVTIGQLDPGASASTCVSAFDWVQPTVTSGNTYVVPATGTITSWSHKARVGMGQTLTTKVFRQVAGLTYMVVGHDGPRDLAGGNVNTFATSISVKAGDVLGLNVGAGSPACTFFISGETDLFRMGNLADGESGTFATHPSRLNIAAVVNPSNTFTLGDIDRDKKKGTAKITVEDVPNPGELVLTGKGLKKASAGGAVIAKTVTAPGDVKLKIRAKGNKKDKLNENGKVKVKPKITFTPTGGDPNTKPRKLKLRKNL